MGKGGAWWERSLVQAKEELASQEEIAHEVSDHLAGQREGRDTDNQRWQNCPMARIAQSLHTFLPQKPNPQVNTLKMNLQDP